MTRAFIGASIVAIVLLAALPRSAAACQVGSIPTVAEALAHKPVIFIGTVAARPAKWTYVVDVSRVYRGDVPRTVTLGNDPSQVVNSCQGFPHVGSTYLFVMDSLNQGYLGIGNMPVQVRRTGIEGTFVNIQNLDVACLLSLLAGLPDSAMVAPPRSLAPQTLIGAILLLLALVSAARRLTRHALAEPRPAVTPHPPLTQ
jgi:hypothetical protein